MNDLALFADGFLNENEQFRKTLTHYLGMYSNNQLKGSSVIDVACGKCREAEVLFDLFGEDVTGIDSDPKVIASLQKRLELHQGYFSVDDARKMTDFIQKKYDVVIMRHVGSDGDWPKIFKESYEVLEDDGIMLSTFYSKIEFLDYRKDIKKAGYKIIEAEENIHGIKFPDHGEFKHGIDRYVILGEKQEQSNYAKAIEIVRNLFNL